MVNALGDVELGFDLLEDSGVLGFLVNDSFECDFGVSFLVDGDINRTSGARPETFGYRKTAYIQYIFSHSLKKYLRALYRIPPGKARGQTP